MKKWVVGILVIVVAGAAFLLFGSSGSAAAGLEAADEQLFTVKRGALPIRLTENGTLVAKESKRVTFSARRGSKIAWLVEEGKRVKEGEVVARLDTESMQTRLDAKENEVLKWQTDLKTANTNLEIQTLENTGKLEKAENALKKAENDFEKYSDGDAPQELRKLEIDLKDKETDLRIATKRYEDSKMLAAKDFIKKTELEQDQISHERATVHKQGADLALQLWHKYTNPMALRDKRIAVENGKRELETTKKRNESQLAQKTAALRQAEKRLEAAKKQLAKYKKELAEMTMKAPCPGIAIYGDPRQPWQRSEIKVGGQVWGGMTLITIPDLRVMQVRQKIHEADINKLKVGQVAKVTMDTYPGLTLDGKVTKIASIAGGRNPWQTSSTVKKFDVEITLTSKPEVTLKPGISAKAEIHIDEVKDTLFVPLQCVFTEDGASYCYIADASGPARRKVDVGQSNENFVEIKDGVAEGEQVLLYNPSLPAGPATSEESDAEKGAEKPATTTPANGKS